MPHISVETPGIKIRGDGVEHEFRIAYDTEETSNQPRVLVHVYKNGQLVGTPIRFWDQDGRIAADLPGVNGESFITNSEGRISS